MTVQDVDRPDVNGNAPKMHAIGQATQDAIGSILPHVVVRTDDNIMSNVAIWATKQPKDQWPGGIFHNARYVIAGITPAKGKRYYEPNIDPLVTVEVSSSNGAPKFRKYTSTPEKAIKKLADYLQALADMD